MRKYAGDIPKDPTHVDKSTRTGEEGKSVQPNPDAPLPILESAPQTCLPSPIGTCVRARFVTTVHLSSAARRSVSACTWPSPPCTNTRLAAGSSPGVLFLQLAWVRREELHCQAKHRILRLYEKETFKPHKQGPSLCLWSFRGYGVTGRVPSNSPSEQIFSNEVLRDSPGCSYES